jgi:phosphoribosyl-dephospho-CoA transferase
MFARHSLVWLSPDGWREAEDSIPADSRHATTLWRQHDWPAVVRRQESDIVEGRLCLGLALPPDPASGRKQRIPLTVSSRHIAKVLAPVTIGSLIADAPPVWAASLESLNSKASAVGLTLRAYGSLALQVLTGQTYLTASSDIDVLLYPLTREQLCAGVALLSEAATRIPIDGEIVFPSGEAVAWKEWINAMDGKTGVRVLAKDSHGVHLALPQTLLATLKEKPCIA